LTLLVQAPHLTHSDWLLYCRIMLCYAVRQGLSDYRTVSGVGSGDAPPPPPGNSSSRRRSSSSSSNTDSSSSAPSGSSHSSGVGCQAGKLPELVIRGQAGSDPCTQGSLQLKGVRALFNKAGGLDISLYSAGMVCADLLSRMQVRGWLEEGLDMSTAQGSASMLSAHARLCCVYDSGPSFHSWPAAAFLMWCAVL
jgi:hypothetical protein